jgi:signal transduction histidine kinase
VSHELRNPMATIRGFAQILRDRHDTIPEETRLESTEVIVRQVDRMAALVDNVLEVSRMESDTFSYAFAPYDLRALLAECVAEARASYPAHKVSLEAAETLPRAGGDRERMKQVFSNLVSNACRYSQDGKEVIVRARANGSSATIDVVDQGAGIAQEQRGLLFQRFARLRTPDTANVRGTGLGLYISRRIVEAHSGRIWVESERGIGSTFSVEIPLAPPPQARAPGASGDRSR